ncbi:MAG: polysaccharide pyruvyl transferase family protein, partial [Lachnospiraceae bacterium]|nr:polysaccharide pyruvyl transferase family protein [Lachnospiraceae bacterium]
DKDYDFINVVSCKPEQIIFIAFPLAVLYKILGWIPGIKSLIKKNKIINAFSNSTMVIDEAGISFVDSRGFVMNTYAFICGAVPMLLGTPVCKYSQAMGTFKNFYNRLLAKIILPKYKLLCARGQATYDNLKGIGIEKNVKLCADGAFMMADDEKWTEEIEKVTSEDAFYQKEVVGLSISSVVEKKCNKMGIAYKDIMVEFINYLQSKGYGVLLIANAARINSTKPRNNDLMIGDAIYNEIADKDNVRWYHKEMDAEEIREYIGKCKCLVASRFHAMVGSLEKKVPVFLIGWSHKYKEVMDMFHLGEYAIDFSKMDAELIKKGFENFESNDAQIRENLEKYHEEVLASSALNLKYITEIIDGME